MTSESLQVSPGDLRSLARPPSQDVRSPGVSRPAYPWKTRLLLPAGLLLALAGLTAYAARASLWPAVDVEVVPVVARAGAEPAGTPGGGPSSSGGSAGGVQAAGWVEPDPFAVAVTSLADGVVKEVLVLEGEAVEAGEVVARLDDADAALALASAEAELAERRAELDAARRNWDHPTERRRAVDAATAAVAEARADRVRLDSLVAAEAARVEELAERFAQIERSFRSNAASEEEYAVTRLQFKAQRATLAEAEARRAVLDAHVRRQEAELAAATENLELRIDDAAALASAEAAVARATAGRDEAALRLRRMDVRSPVGGVVLSRRVEVGSKIMLGMDDPQSATAVRLYDPEKLQVRVDVPLADAAKVGLGMAAEVVVGVLPDRTFRGVVTRVVPEADVAKNTLQVKVAIEDPSAELRPEMLARVRFVATPAGSAGDSDGDPGSGHLLFAPEALIERDGDNAAAWVVDRSGGGAVAARRRVEVGGARRDGWVSVASGLSAGDLLIARPAGVSDGAAVRVVGEADGVPQSGGR